VRVSKKQRSKKLIRVLFKFLKKYHAGLKRSISCASQTPSIFLSSQHVTKTSALNFDLGIENPLSGGTLAEIELSLFAKTGD
jgi:hypothetical protein